MAANVVQLGDMVGEETIILIWTKGRRKSFGWCIPGEYPL